MLHAPGLGFVAAAVDDDVGAARCEFEHDRATYVASRTCHENRLAGEIEVLVDRHRLPPDYLTRVRHRALNRPRHVGVFSLANGLVATSQARRRLPHLDPPFSPPWRS